MRRRLLGSVAAWLTGSGALWAQYYPAYPPMPQPYYQPPAPRVQGWPPAPGTIPQPGQSVQIVPVKQSQMPRMPAPAPHSPPPAPGRHVVQVAQSEPVIVHQPPPSQYGEDTFVGPSVADGPTLGPPVEVHRGFQYYGKAEVLLWQINQPDSPDLVLTSNGTSGSSQMFNEDQVYTGGRFTFGSWLDPKNSLALEGTFFFLGEQTPSQTFDGALGGRLSVPLVDPLGNPASYAIAGANQSGQVVLNGRNSIMGAEGNLRRELCSGAFWHIDLLGGFRWFQLDESLGITTDTVVAGLNDAVRTNDTFNTRNRILAGQIGVDAEVQFWRIFINPYGKFAFGINREEVNIDGNRVVTTAGVAQNLRGGLFAQPSNSGETSVSEFTPLLEGGLNVGYQFTNRIRVQGGYQYLWVQNVARPGGQVNPVVDLTQATQNPTPLTSQAQFFTNAFNLGFELRY